MNKLRNFVIGFIATFAVVLAYGANIGFASATGSFFTDHFTWSSSTRKMQINTNNIAERGWAGATFQATNSNLTAWAAIATSTKQPVSYIVTGTGATLVATNDVYAVNVASQTVTLPTAVGITGKTYTIKCIAPATSATVATTSSQVIDGATTYSLNASNKFVRVISDGVKYLIIGAN